MNVVRWVSLLVTILIMYMMFNEKLWSANGNCKNNKMNSCQISTVKWKVLVMQVCFLKDLFFFSVNKRLMMILNYWFYCFFFYFGHAIIGCYEKWIFNKLFFLSDHIFSLQFHNCLGWNWNWNGSVWERDYISVKSDSMK